ncbi:MAG: hypothetical protein KatS3mg108_1270 [Isosphaeraceae bacterium]|jgi:hypothetical protein|nr:MAG: hypothetical protein KatS3mg108_1270 [Isosphaeraceae bacterium]
MTQSASPEPAIFDPLGDALRRESRRGAAIEVLVRDFGDPDRVQSIGSGLVELARAAGHQASWRTVAVEVHASEGQALQHAIAAASAPLVLYTTAVEPWTAAHLRPLLDAIERADHVLGRRPLRGPMLWQARFRKLIRSILFATPILDPHTPCRLHRREAISAIPLQSESCYVDVELLAKATFLGQIIEEVDVPWLPADENPQRRLLWSHDRADLWRRPVFRPLTGPPLSAPAEDPQRDPECPDRPGGENQQMRNQTLQPHALENNGAQPGCELRER